MDEWTTTQTITKPGRQSHRSPSLHFSWLIDFCSLSSRSQSANWGVKSSTDYILSATLLSESHRAVTNRLKEERWENNIVQLQCNKKFSRKLFTLRQVSYKLASTKMHFSLMGLTWRSPSCLLSKDPRAQLGLYSNEDQKCAVVQHCR